MLHGAAIMLDAKKIVKIFARVIFLVNISIVVSFFYSRLRPRESYR